jgi:O-antigen chain-terminating methyltransferase
VPGDAERIAELNAIVEAVRERVRNGSAQPGAGMAAGSGSLPPGSILPIRVLPADLMPLVHARDAAQAKIAAIGAVNPRAGGALNGIVQAVKKLIARALQWFVRDQVVFNRETITALEATLEALNEQNRSLVALAAQANERFDLLRWRDEETRDTLARELRESDAALRDDTRALREETRALGQEMLAEARELKDVRTHWVEWRAGWEQKLATNEIQFLRAAADLQGAFQHRVSLIEENFRGIVQAQHRDYLGALDRANVDIQKRLWADLEKVRENYERMIHSELRLIRLRAGGPSIQAAGLPGQPAAPAPALDYSRFAERFRGTDEQIRRNMEFYRPFFEGRDNVLDIGCGRGEFLEVMREAGIPARGIDLSPESVAQCRDKGLTAEIADLFAFLAAQPDGEFDGILSSQVVEHLPPDRIPEMIRLCGAKLRHGGVLAIETPNPECLAIFATYFYLDPTHTRPMPHQYLQFCMEEAGLTGIEVHPLAPAIDTMPELASLPADFRERFFGGLDYAILGRRM